MGCVHEPREVWERSPSASQLAELVDTRTGCTLPEMKVPLAHEYDDHSQLNPSMLMRIQRITLPQSAGGIGNASKNSTPRSRAAGTSNDWVGVLRVAVSSITQAIVRELSETRAAWTQSMSCRNGSRRGDT